MENTQHLRSRFNVAVASIGAVRVVQIAVAVAVAVAVGSSSSCSSISSSSSSFRSSRSSSSSSSNSRSSNSSHNNLCKFGTDILRLEVTHTSQTHDMLSPIFTIQHLKETPPPCQVTYHLTDFGGQKHFKLGIELQGWSMVQLAIHKS